MGLESMLADARAARSREDYPTAEKLCAAYLSVYPGHPGAESLLGLCKIEQGDAAGAALIERAAKTNPDDGMIALNLSALREAQGDMREAVRSASEAARLAPQRFEGWAQLGKLLGAAGRFDEAVTALETALRIAPDNAGIAKLLTVAAIETDALDIAQAALRAFERAAPGSEEGLQLRAQFARAKNDWAGLAEAAAQWLAKTPDNNEPRAALAHALSKLGYYERAAETYAPLIRKASTRRDQADHLAALGRYLIGARQLDKAGRAFGDALAADFTNAEAAYGLARIALYRGDTKQATAHARQALQSNPRHADSWGLLAEATGGRLDEAELQTLASVARDEKLPVDSRVIVSFALGDAHHARGERDQAFSCWRYANSARSAALARAGKSYVRTQQAALARRLMKIFSSDPLGGARFIDDDDDGRAAAPIFIVGMPRSGTTLLETALSAHPQVDPAGESPAMPFVFGQLLDFLTVDGDAMPPDRLLAEWRRRYLEETRKFAPGVARFVSDKQPTNFLAVGLIRMLFPSARIILIRRDPIETGFSIFRRNFGVGWSFATDLSHIGHYLATQAALCAHWQATLGDGLLTVQYEDLAGNFEPQMRRVVEHCGLDWHEACASPESASREVFTFSASQVREKVTATRGRSAEPYMTHLAPLIETLQSMGVNLATGASTRGATISD